MREGFPTHGSRRGLNSTAPVGAVEPFSECDIYSTNFSYGTLGVQRGLRLQPKTKPSLPIAPP